MADLDQLTIGLVFDMFTEKNNDSCEDEEENGVRMASQADFDRW